MSVTATRLNRVRVRCEGLDQTTARLRLGQLLGGAELRPPGLPSAAVLCVRRLNDPRPGTLAMVGGQAGPPPEWERAVIGALERMLAAAARPARGAVPAGAEAVLFADRAEFLACLARDLCAGTAWGNWWWHGILETAVGNRAEPAVRRWLREPEHVPASLELLATWGAAVRFAQAIEPPVALQLAVRVAGVFAAPELYAALTASPVAPAHSTSLPTGARHPALPGARFAPEATALVLQAEQALLLSTVLTLRRAPVHARSRVLADEVRQWRFVAGASMPAPDVATTTPAAPVFAAETRPTRPRRRPAPRRLRPRLASADTAAAPPGPAVPNDRDLPAPMVATDHADGARPTTSVEPITGDTPVTQDPTAPAASGLPVVGTRASPHPRRPDAEVPGESWNLPPRVPPRARADAEAVATSLADDAPPPSKVAPDASARPILREPALVDPDELALALQTELGGLFYLLNLALALGLYGDFTAPLEPGIGLNPWELVELLGVRLLGRRPDDPIWELLASLAARRPGEPAGRGFRPLRTWRVPSAWLEPFEHDGTWRWSAAAGLLRIVHPVGFTVTAVPRSSATPEAQLRRELRRLRPLRPVAMRTSLGREPTHPVARWVARLGAYADARIRLALGLGADTRVASVLLAQPARVLVSPSHVNVVLELATLPLEVRVAGLDRNPGWIPAAGRFVAFEFV
jgi:hypothetical protein